MQIKQLQRFNQKTSIMNEANYANSIYLVLICSSFIAYMNILFRLIIKHFTFFCSSNTIKQKWGLDFRFLQLHIYILQMNYANPFSLTSYTSFLSPKDQRSRLTSFQSNNQSIKSNKSVSPKMNFIPQPQFLKTQQLSPKSQFLSQHQNQKLTKKPIERIKYVSEHTSTPYLYIQKKQNSIHFPVLPKLSPESKIESPKIPNINIMTEPTIIIEEQAEEQESNVKQKKQLQLLLNNNLLQVSQLSQNQDDQLSNSKLSIRSRFKKAVQNSFHSPPRKSLFNVIISHEFNVLHEEEKPQLLKKFEPGNQILAQKFTMKIEKNVSKNLKYIKDIHLKKQFGLINLEQFNVSTKAFQRKINLIHSTSSRSLMHQEQFSLLPKSSRKSIHSISSQIQNNAFFINSNKKLDKINQNQKSRNSKEKKQNLDQTIEVEKTKFHIIITYENVEKLSFQFNKPQHLNQQKVITDEIVPLLSPQSPRQIIPQSLISLKNLSSSRQLNQNQSSRNLVANKISKISIPSVFSEEAGYNLDLKYDFSKPNLYVRVYYQNKLYKLMQKTNYTKSNLKEIEENFKPKIALSNSTIMTNVYTVMSTSEQGIRQRKITNENLNDKFQFLGIQLSKYNIEKEKIIYHYDDEYSNKSETLTSQDSDQDISLDNFLESPIYNNKPKSKQINSLKSQKTLYYQDQHKQQLQTQFIKDDPIDEKQLSTGALILIKKRMAFQIPLFLQPIISILEQKTKNHLLTYNVIMCDNYKMGVLTDKHQNVYEKLIIYQRNSTLNKVICQAIEFRYPSILIGRYNCQTRMIDVEHQDPISQTMILEKQENKQDKSDTLPQQQTLIKSSARITSKELKDSITKRKTINAKRQQGLTKQDSLQVTQPQQWNKRTILSGELTNPLTITNQQNTNLFTQASTVMITKPTLASQQSVFKVPSSKHIDLNSSQQDISSSFHSSQNDESRRSSKIEQIQNQHSSQTQYAQPPQQQVLKMQNQNEESFKSVQEQKDKFHLLQESKNALSMYMYALKMRTHIKESQRRQKLDTKQLIQLAIYDYNFTEFIDNIQLIPEMQIDVPLQNGNTYLILAAQCGCKEIVYELIKRGADINIQNNDGNTAVHLALAYGHYQIADMLIQAGGNTHILNKEGLNAWSVL
ncbi:unnamed protein product [Paramecium sonneborni]|uniref:Uncharacterized protein n=1 Tax=Paramecium sonneborni TaxID=65129 RepID=A0A8S1NGY9_9CILI|nr:unnamed protein product [Paramecium sonneborni]